MLNKLLLTPIPTSGGWPGTPVQIVNDDVLWGFSGHRAIVKTSGGDLYAIFSIGCFASTNGGLTWSESLDDFHKPATSFAVDIDIDSTGLIHVVYLSTENPANLKHTTFDTSTDLWAETPETIVAISSQITDTYWRVGCVIDSNDHLHVVFCDGAIPDVKYTNNISDDWTKTPVTLSSTAYHGSICLTPSDYPVILYSDATTGMYAALGNAVDAVNFGTPTNIGAEAGWKGSIACDGSGNIWCAWTGRLPYTGNALKASKHNVGDSWATWNAVTVDSENENTDANIMCIGTAAYIFCTHESIGVWYWTNATGSWVSHELDAGGIQPLVRWANNNNPSYDDGIDYVFLMGDLTTHTVYYNRLVL